MCITYTYRSLHHPDTVLYVYTFMYLNTVYAMIIVFEKYMTVYIHQIYNAKDKKTLAPYTK